MTQFLMIKIERSERRLYQRYLGEAGELALRTPGRRREAAVLLPYRLCGGLYSSVFGVRRVELLDLVRTIRSMSAVRA